MMTLPQINLYSHGTQWTVSHGHFAFWGAYACGVIAFAYLAAQKAGQVREVNGGVWKWGFATLNLGLVGMVGALLVAGITQAFVERAMGGSTLRAFMAAQQNGWFVQAMNLRFAFGLVFAAGYVMLVYDLATMGQRARKAGFAPAITATPTPA